MVEIKFVDIIGFKTEDPKFPTTNLLRDNKWLCEKKFCSSVNDVTLRLEKVFTISAIDIGNFGSAFICFEVSRMGLLRYETLLPTTSLMSAQDCKEKENWSCVKMFKTEDFNPDVCKQKWDLLRIICMQPFIKDVQFGLSFVKAFSHLNSIVEQVSLDVNSSNRLRKPRKQVSPRAVTSLLSRSEKLMEKINMTCAKYSPSNDKQSGNVSSTSTDHHQKTVVPGSLDSSNVSCVGIVSSSGKLRANIPRHAAISTESSECSSLNKCDAISSHKSRKRKLNMPFTSQCTRTKNVAQSPVRETLEIGSDSDSDGEATLIEKTLPAKDDSDTDTDTVVIIPSSPDSISSQVTDIVENGSVEEPEISQKSECPICFETFEASKIEEHAACCANIQEVMVCPICNNFFPPNILQMHADLCAGKLSSSP